MKIHLQVGFCAIAMLCAGLLVTGCDQRPATMATSETGQAAGDDDNGTLAAAATAAALVSIELPAPNYALRESNLPGHTLATSKCVICHSTDYISFQPPGMTLAQWTAEMQKMRDKYGAPLVDAEVELIGAYLAVAYGSASATDADIVAVSETHAEYLDALGVPPPPEPNSF